MNTETNQFVFGRSVKTPTTFSLNEHFSQTSGEVLPAECVKAQKENYENRRWLTALHRIYKADADPFVFVRKRNTVSNPRK